MILRSRGVTDRWNLAIRSGSDLSPDLITSVLKCATWSSPVVVLFITRLLRSLMASCSAYSDLNASSRSWAKASHFPRSRSAPVAFPAIFCVWNESAHESASPFRRYESTNAIFWESSLKCFGEAARYSRTCCQNRWKFFLFPSYTSGGLILGDPLDSSLSSAISRIICAWILANSSASGVDSLDGPDDPSSDGSDRSLYGSLGSRYVDVMSSCCPRYWLSTK